jgi:hypothetical protein
MPRVFQVKFVSIFFLLSVASGQTNGQKNLNQEQAEQKGQQLGEDVGSQVVLEQQQGLSTQETNFDTLAQSSVDSLMNSQKGEATATLMTGSLIQAAKPYAQNCDPTSESGITACSTGSVLTGMSGLMSQSTDSFAAPIDLAWKSVCIFSAAGCGTAIIPNPFTPLVNVSGVPNPADYDNLIETFKSNGYDVNPRTGIVSRPDGSTIDPNNSKSIEKAIGKDGYSALEKLLDKMQKDISNQLSKVKLNTYLKSLGLKSIKEIANKMATNRTGDSDSAISRKAKDQLNYNRIEKPNREKIEINELFKRLNGTPIGVSGADLFKMIKIRYEKKAFQNYFLKSL